MPSYSEISPIIIHGVYSQKSVDRIAALDSLAAARLSEHYGSRYTLRIYFLLSRYTQDDAVLSRNN